MHCQIWYEKLVALEEHNAALDHLNWQSHFGPQEGVAPQEASWKWRHHLSSHSHLRFEEDVALEERMAAIGQTVRDKGYPDFLLFQVCSTHCSEWSYPTTGCFVY